MTKQELIAQLQQEVRGAQVAVATRDQAVRERLGINPTDHRCLDIIHQRGSMKPSELADALHLSRSAVTTVIDRLENMRYVRRIRGVGDRREVLVELTPLLLRRAERLYGDGQDTTAMLERYSAAELELLCDFVRRDREHNEERANALGGASGRAARRRRAGA
jgi:DNA-binding MarR family transcriptional regulator